MGQHGQAGRVRVGLNDDRPAVAAVPAVRSAQAMGETSHAVASGGISVPGWTGKSDANEAAKGSMLENSKLAVEGSGMQ